jgi:hypothetical protein
MGQRLDCWGAMPANLIPHSILTATLAWTQEPDTEPRRDQRDMLLAALLG